MNTQCHVTTITFNDTVIIMDYVMVLCIQKARIRNYVVINLASNLVPVLSLLHFIPSLLLFSTFLICMVTCCMYMHVLFIYYKDEVLLHFEEVYYLFIIKMKYYYILKKCSKFY